MWTLIKNLAAPLSSLCLMMVASGLFNTFVSIRLEIQEYTPEMIGIVISALYAGIVVGSLWIDRWVSKQGHIRAFLILGIVLGLLVLAQAVWINPWYWAALRFIGGICTAGIFVIIESWLLMQTIASERGGVLSIYLAVCYGSLALGQLFLNVAPPVSSTPYIITSVLLVLSLIPLIFSQGTAPIGKEQTPLNIWQFCKASPLGFLGALISGMLLAICFGLAPVYAKEMGMSIKEISTYMAVLIFGGFSLQWPAGKWADKTERRFVIKIMSLIGAAIALLIARLGVTPFYVQLILAWFFGGFSFTVYPLSMAYACESVQENQIVAATGGFVLSYGIGAILGPLLAPIAMSFFGPSGLFYFLGLILLTLYSVGLKRAASATVDK